MSIPSCEVYTNAADLADITLFQDPTSDYQSMVVLCITQLPLLGILVSTLATPGQPISLAGREHGLRRTNLRKRAGHGGDRGSGCRAKAAATSSITSASVEATNQAASTATSASSATITASTASSSSSAAAPREASATGDVSAGGKALTPNGIKAGMTLCTGLEEFVGKLGWCYG